MADGEEDIETKIEAIAEWLSESDLEDYLPLLLENGYNSLAKCIRIDLKSLPEMGVSNEEHVEKFEKAVSDLKTRGIRGSPSPGSVDPDQVYKDFVDEMEVEKQKQVANVPSIEVSEAGSNDGAGVRRRMGTLARKEALKRLSMNTMTKCLSVDLDSLLDDLCKMELAVRGPEAPEIKSDSGNSNDGNKPLVSDLDFNKFLEEMRAHAQPDVPNIVAVEDFVHPKADPSEDVLKQLSEDVEAIIREAAAENAEKDEERERELSPTPKEKEKKKKTEVEEPPPAEREPTPPTPSQVEVRAKLEATKTAIEKDKSLTEAEREIKLKETKILIAMEKLKEAHVQKLVVKVMCPDGFSKMLVVDEHKLARDVTAMMIVKLHADNDPCYCLLERLTDLHLERVLEDHERVVPFLACWPRDNNNTLHFVHRPNKYRLLTRPQDYMPKTHPYATGKDCPFDDNVRRDLIVKELFMVQQLPELEGQLRYMCGSKGKWKKHYFVLRKSGLYYNVKGKSTSILDVVRLVDWSNVDIYTGKEYKKCYKAPTEFCLSLKPIGPTDTTKHHIHHVCAQSKYELSCWLHGMRLAKFGSQLRTDYDQTIRLMPWLELESEAEETDGGMPHTPLESSTEDSDGTEEEIIGTQGGGFHGHRADVKVSEEEVDERNLTLLQRKFRNAWQENAIHDDSSDVPIFSFGTTPLSPPYTTPTQGRPNSMAGIATVDEDGMFTVKLK